VHEEGGEPVFKHGDLTVDLTRRRVTRAGDEIKLSPKEYDILRLLVLHAGKVLTHRVILQEVWSAAGDVQYLRIYIRQLRQKLEADPDRPELILTETGVGYRLADLGA
jgi:two-component system, OmpR family, KDP operon response regulator KdpE